MGRRRPTPTFGPALPGTAAGEGRASTPAVRLDSVVKVYGSGRGAAHALNGVTLALERGSFTAAMGPSGSGKTTLLNCAAGLTRPTSGRVWLGDTELSRLKEGELTELRRERVGFVFQDYNLLDPLTVEQNVTLPPRLGDKTVDHARVRTLLAEVGLESHQSRYPGQLSGGQRQRVAIARALINGPDVVLADEPTGALDTRTGRQILELLRRVVTTMGQTVLMVTHDPVAASYADSVVFLADGRLAGALVGPSPEQIAERMTRLGDW